MSALEVQIHDGVATLTMNRPEARNALSTEMKEAFAAAVPALAADPAVRALVLTGANAAFCAGGDLRGMAEVRARMKIGDWRDRMREVQPWIKQLIELDKPLIAAVDGPAFGAGFSLALMADFVLASPRARFCLSFMRVGLVPDFAAMYTLPRVVGVQRAKELMLSAREIDAAEAQALGIVMEVHGSAALEARALAIAQSLTNAAPAAVALTKAALNVSLDSDRAGLFALEAASQAAAFAAPEPMQALDAMLARRAPPYTGFPKAES